MHVRHWVPLVTVVVGTLGTACGSDRHAGSSRDRHARVPAPTVARAPAVEPPKSPTPAPPAEPVTTGVAISDIEPSACDDRGPACADSVERTRIASAPGWVRRGPRLTYRAPNGRELVLVDDSTEGGPFQAHRYLGALAGTAYVGVGRTYYEGSDYLLVHVPTATVAELTAGPVLSPDRQRVVAASMDFEAGELPIQLDVWRLAATGAVREYSITPGTWAPSASGWGPANPRWLDPETVEFTKYEPTPDGRGRTSRARLVHQVQGWTVVTSKAP